MCALLQILPGEVRGLPQEQKSLHPLYSIAHAVYLLNGIIIMFHCQCYFPTCIILLCKRHYKYSLPHPHDDKCEVAELLYFRECGEGLGSCMVIKTTLAEHARVHVDSTRYHIRPGLHM